MTQTAGFRIQVFRPDSSMAQRVRLEGIEVFHFPVLPFPMLQGLEHEVFVAQPHQGNGVMQALVVVVVDTAHVPNVLLNAENGTVCETRLVGVNLQGL